MNVGFNWGGWTTSGTARRMSENAVLANRAAIRVAQFMEAPNPEDNARKFRETKNYMRTGFIDSGSWDRMPGEVKASWHVSSPCVAGIETQLKAAQGSDAPAG